MFKNHFPILNHQSDLVYLDSAATALKPKPVIEATVNYLQEYSANIHRGLYPLAERATAAYEGARLTVAYFLQVAPEEIIFTKNATEGINLVAESFLRPRLKSGQKIVVSAAEHHSNLLPWWRLAQETDAELITVPLTVDGRLNLSAMAEFVADGSVAMLSLTLASNVTGELVLVSELLQAAKAAGVPTLLDAAQAAAHVPLDMAQLPADFLVFSGHKVYGPTGIGVLFGRREHLSAMPPWQLGGDMVTTVHIKSGQLQPVWSDLPGKFEAGTPPIAEAIGLAAALTWMKEIGTVVLARHDAELTEHGLNVFSGLPGFQLLGPTNPVDRLPIFSLVHERIHSHDLASFLAEQGIAVRAGQHCAAPLLQQFGASSAIRISCGVYTDKIDLDAAAKALTAASQLLDPHV